ncbi:MAG: SRPBCC domain-containing protein, partial [Planctomycetales bacterium]|nr:SRPBCC domain-containing protein [Planctomycetales bacterium]
GGRWFRDLGAGQGHLWGFVQVIKPPTLLELHGPMFMSYPVAGHMQFRLTQIAGGVELYLRHRVVGPVEDEHRQGVVPGWNYLLEQTKKLAEQAS